MLPKLKPNTENLLHFAVCFLILFSIYSPVVFIPYAHHDDFFFLRTTSPVIIENHVCHAGNITIGRPLAAWVITFCNWGINTLNDLAVARFIFIATLSVCCYLYAGFLKKYFFPPIESLLVAVTLFSLPSFEVLVAMASAGYILFAILLSLAAALIIDCIDEEEHRIKPTIQYLGSFCLLFSALLIYSSGAMFFWVIPAHIIFLGWEQCRKKMFSFFSVGLTAIFSYALFLQVIKPYFVESVDSFYNPYAVTHDYLGKFLWFINEPLLTSLNLWDIYPSGVSAFISSALLGAAFTLVMLSVTLKLRKPSEKQNVLKKLVVTSGIFLCLLILSFTPNLAAPANAGFYRCTAALTVIVIFAVIGSLRLLLSLLFRSAVTRIFTIVLLILCLYGGYRANQNVYWYRVFPSFVELSFLDANLKGVDIQKDLKIYFMFPPFDPLKRHGDEFGTPSSWYESDLTSMALVTLIRQKKIKYFPVAPSITTAKIFDDSVPASDKKILFIDMRKLYAPSGLLHYLSQNAKAIY